MSKKVIILIEDLFEDVEAIYPYYRLKEEGYEVSVVGPEKDRVYEGKHGLALKADFSSEKLNINDISAVVIPGGYAPDKMVRTKSMVDIVKEASKECKIIAAICHGPLMLVEAGVIEGKKVTGFISIKTPLKLAGAEFIDKATVTDANILTSRSPDDLPQFCKALITLINIY
ncbi:MAG: type 1 glutamine amidotransferase [Actinobacteria bacterium]|nr:type 1 glutamine amidotransferase [Actinomycetota bacterium]MCL5070133.1 type 1 glutamine amidotransferase [Actinomycetota bacterium]